MTSPAPSMPVIVVADDSVEAGMLALDLVQAGFDAHAAGDEKAALAQVADLREGGHANPGVVAAYQDIRRASVLSRQLISAGLATRFVAVVRDRDRAVADEEAQLLDWTGVVAEPPNAEVLASALRSQDGQFKAQSDQTEEGDLSRDAAQAVLTRILERAARSSEHRDCVLQLAAGDRHGQVAIVDGRIVHAQADQDTGRHALERICCWRKGDWRVTYARYTGERTVRGGDTALAAAGEYARRLASARGSVPNLEAVCTVRWERVRPLPVVAEAMFHRIASGMVLRDALAGEGDDELEAFAALVSRIRRGAVVPQATSEQPQQHNSKKFSLPKIGSERTRSFDRSSGHSMVPGISVAAPRAAVRAARAHKTDAYPRTPVAPVADDAMTRRIAPQDIPRDLPEVPRHRPRSKTPSNAILPATLPEYESDGHVPLQATVPTITEDTSRSTGWFGLNVGAEGGAQRTVPKAAAVIPPAPVPTHEPAATVNVTETVANLPRKRPRQSTDMIKQAFSEWTNDYQATDRAVEEASVMFKTEDLVEESSKGAWIWVAALLIVGALSALVLVPELGVLDPQPAVAKESPIMATYRRAVGLIENGRRVEAVALLNGVQNHAGIPAEALLQLAVLEIELERYEAGRSHLERYIDNPRAQEAKRAKRLYAHVFGDRR